MVSSRNILLCDLLSLQLEKHWASLSCCTVPQRCDGEVDRTSSCHTITCLNSYELPHTLDLIEADSGRVNTLADPLASLTFHMQCCPFAICPGHSVTVVLYIILSTLTRLLTSWQKQ
jgi:hypothetical protein